MCVVSGTSEPPGVGKSTSSQRWVPPNARERLNTSQQTFRRIRGILNKLTPDNFDRLSRELVHLASSSNDRNKLKGAILLVFDKAVDEPSYSSMYAQLCLRLSEFAPNFEDPGSKANTFWKLLLHKCQEEFENRKRANEVFVGRNELSAEEEEQRALAKRKMLGNIKFVGELFKLGMVHEAIIHSCIKELLERKKGQSVDDVCQNLECLCRCMTTVGQKLDTEKAKGWMDKYFSRISSLSNNQELPPRIRFMLLNVTDLRKGNWSSHHVTASHTKPRPIHEIRQEAIQTKLLSSAPPPLNITPFTTAHPQRAPYGGPPPGATGDEGFVTSPLKDSPLSPQETQSFVPHTHTAGTHGHQKAPPVEVKQQPPQEKKYRRLPSSRRDDTVSLRPALSSLKLGSGSSRHANQPNEKGPPLVVEAREEVRSHVPRTRDDSSDDEDSVDMMRGQAQGLPPAAVGVGLHPSLFPLPPPHYPLPPPPHPHMLPHGPLRLPYDQRPMRFAPHGGRGMPLPVHPPPPFSQGPHFPPKPGSYYGAADMPQPFHPQVFALRPPGPPMRPGPHRPPHAVRPQPPPLPPTSTHNGSTVTSDAPRGLPPGLDRNEPVPVRYASKHTGGKKTGSKPRPPSDENERALDPIIRKYLRSLDVAAAVTAIRTLQKISLVAVCTLVMVKTLGKSEDDRTHISHLLCELHSQQVITSSDFSKAFQAVLTTSTSLEADLPQCKIYLAGFAARAIARGVVTLKEVAPTFEQGAHHPTVLVLLQALLSLIGEDELYMLFSESRLTLTSLVPVELRSHDTITEITEAKKLGFLYPLKRIQSEIGSMLKSVTSAGGLYKWIEGNVDSSLYSSPDFIMIITRTILHHATSDTSLARDISRSLIPSPEIISTEKISIGKYKILVQKFVSESIPLQVVVLYTTQVFCNDNKFPKGLVLRLFSYWYEMDVVDGEALIQWREDMSQDYPGKGQALFQVNHWLTLVEEAEDEDTSDED